MKRRNLPKYVSCHRDQHGRPRYRFRRKGFKSYYFKSEPHTESFRAEYDACMLGEKAPRLVVGKDSIRAGTIKDLVHRYYASPKFRKLRDSTKQTYRNQLNRFCDQHGDKPVRLLKRKHVTAILGKMADRPGAADSLLARLKVLLKFAVDIEMIPLNPLIELSGFHVRTGGFHSWTDDEIAQFLARHPQGSKARLALSLLLYTGQRRSDVVKMGWQHVTENTIAVVQQKTGSRLILPLHPTLRSELELQPSGNQTFIAQSNGNPYAVSSFGNWFRRRCREADLRHCSPHGLRKAAARMLAEAGCSNQQIKAVTGHQTEAEVSRYTEAADQQQLAESAFEALTKDQNASKMSNSVKNVRHLKG